MVYMFFANGFEETEAIAPLDIMRRAGIEVKTISINPSREVTGSHGITYVADTTAADIDASVMPEAVILPGGMPGTTNLGACDAVCAALKRAYDAGKVVAAICAAPSVLGQLGLLEGKKAVCYPGFEDKLLGAKVEKGPVVVDGRVITAKAMGAACEFGLALVTALVGSDAAKKVADSAFIG